MGISGLILAGGAGSRLGGADKGLVELCGKPLIEHLVGRLRPQVDELLISANRNATRYAALGYPVVKDLASSPQETYAGPLAGLQAGLAQASHSLLLCVPCDTPRLPLDLAARLLGGLGDATIAVARCDGHPQPTVCLVRRSSLPALDEFIRAGERKMGRWQRQLKAVYVDFPDAAAFANLNTAEDFAYPLPHSVLP